MATFRTRKNKDGDILYVAVVRRKHSDKTFQKSKTFTKKKLAEVWARNLEAKLDEEGVDGFLGNPITIAQLIEMYQAKFKDLNKWGRSKEFALNAMKRSVLGDKCVTQLKSKDFIDYAMSRRETAQGSTVANDLTHLHAVLQTAKPVFGLDFNLSTFEEARQAMTANKIIHKAKKRDRRPTADELDKLCDYFTRKSRSKIPMTDIIWFAIHSTRRIDEIMRLRWEDLDVDKMTCVVRDLKHPTDKDGNHQVFRLLSEAMEIIQRQPRDSEYIFPYNSKTAGGKFTRACRMLNIEDLRFHDLRHEAVSRLFERGYQIHEVCLFSLHVSWDTLRRYTNLRAEDVRNIAPN